MSKLKDIIPDDNNPNKHSQKGNNALRTSMEKFGFREAGTLDKNNRIVGGNHRAEIATELSLNSIQIIDADPSRPVFLRYRDLDLDDPENPARELSVALNRAAELSITWDSENMAKHLLDGVDLSDWFSDKELADILEELLELDENNIDSGESFTVIPGQIWELPSRMTNSHIVAVMDSKQALQHLFAEISPDVIFTINTYDILVKATETFIFSEESKASLTKWFAKNNNNLGIVYDGCLGLGETLIASEESGALCYGSEIDSVKVYQLLATYQEKYNLKPKLVAH